MDDGPPAREFLDEEYDEDLARLGDDEPLALTADRLKKASGVAVAEDAAVADSLDIAEDAPPPTPPKI